MFAKCGVDAQSDLNLANSAFFEFPDVDGVFLAWVSCQLPMKKVALSGRNYHWKNNESRKRYKWSTRSVYVMPVKLDPSCTSVRYKTHPTQLLCITILLAGSIISNGFQNTLTTKKTRNFRRHGASLPLSDVLRPRRGSPA